MSHRTFTLLALALLGASCVEGRVFQLQYQSPLHDGGTQTSESFLQGQTSVDLLFVIDNTYGMQPVQSALAAGIGTVLQRMGLARMDWRIGVISSDLGIDPHSGPGCTVQGGDRAELQSKPRTAGCAPPPGPYITANNVADPAAAFQCIALLGSAGCGFERPFDAALRAVDPATQPVLNKGFLRDTALLMVIWVTNEDDCSATNHQIYDPDLVSLGLWTSYRCFAHDVECSGKAPDGSLTGCQSGKGAYLRPVKQVADQLGALKPMGSAAVVVVSGPAAPVRVDQAAEPKLLPSCSGTGGVQATPAIRLLELVSLFGQDGAALPVCGSDVGQRLADAVVQLGSRTGPYCLRHALHDPAQPGCSVVVAPPGGFKTTVPPSSVGSPGFRIIHPVSPGCQHGALVFDDAVTPPAGAVVTITCDFVSST